jgi:hypothetical protein
VTDRYLIDVGRPVTRRDSPRAPRPRSPEPGPRSTSAYAPTAPTPAGATRAEWLGNPGEHARLQWLHRIQLLPSTRALR